MTVVVKLGGGVATDAVDLVLGLARRGAVCVVHGAGPQISAEMARAGLPVSFVRGRRVTTPEGLEVVRRSLAAVNAELCGALGPDAVGLHGDEIGLRATAVPELGLVGQAVPSRPQAVLDALAAGRIPVVTPLAVGVDAKRLLFVSDVPGLLLGGAVASRIAGDEAERLLDDGLLDGGIVPKLRAAVAAARGGVTTEIGATAVVA